MRVAKILGLVMATLVLVALGGLSLLGITPSYIMSAPAVATGIGAKLLCSARYVSGFSEEQSIDDLVQYSAILDRLTVEYDEEAQRVTARFFGFAEKSSTFIPGVGCAIDYPDYSVRETLAEQVLPSQSDSSPWPLGDTVATIDAAVQREVDAVLAQDNAQGLNTRALLVVKGGKILGEAYAQGADAQTPLLGWSMAKSLTAVMLASLEHRGLLDLSAPAGFSEWQGDGRSAIAIRDLLTMTDGLDFSEQYNPGDDATAMLFDAPSAADYVLAKPLAHAPGSRYNYSSGTANLLARIHQDALGGPVAARADYELHIAQALGFQNAIFETDAAGTPVGSSYLYASARDWARLGQLMLNGGVINGQRVFAQGWVGRATTPNGSANFRAYGYQWWLNDGDAQLAWPDLPADSYSAMGNRKQLVMVVPSADAVIVRLGWTAGQYPDSQNFARLLEAL
jgi:CubicO group peptidase (beta-lactamase class C family)